MKRVNRLLAYGAIGLLAACAETNTPHKELQAEFPESFTVKVENTTTRIRTNCAVIIMTAEIKQVAPRFNANAFLVVDQTGELPSQADDLDGDGCPDEIAFLTTLAANETRDCTVRYALSGDKQRDYPKRTQAELSHKFGGEFVEQKYIGGEFRNVSFVRAPDEHTDHSEFFRYEGPGWESDKVGYRFYLDWRNATDIFGKRTPGMILQNVGLDGFDSYHEMADWGMDILKVGSSLGIGSIGMMQNGKIHMVSQTDSVTCAIVANGPVRSIIRTTYYGWKVGEKKYKLTSTLSITAGSRMTIHSVEISNEAANICTGLVRDDQVEILDSSNSGQWQYLAQYGKQSLSGDNLGMAILYHQDDLIGITADAASRIAILKPSDGKLTYYFLAAWEQEPDGIKSKDEFITYLNATVNEMNHLPGVQVQG